MPMAIPFDEIPVGVLIVCLQSTFYLELGLLKRSYLCVVTPNIDALVAQLHSYTDLIHTYFSSSKTAESLS